MWKLLVVVWSGALCAQSLALNEWMILGIKDGILEDATKLRLTQAAHQASLKLVESRRRLFEMNERLWAVHANSEDDFRRSQMEWVREERRSERLLHETAYQKIGIEINQAMLESNRTGQVDWIAIEQLYWQRWEHRCQGIGAALAESQITLDYWEWMVATERQLASGMIAEETLIRDEMEREELRQRTMGFRELHTDCLKRPFVNGGTSVSAVREL